jgi:hypothetical protein
MTPIACSGGQHRALGACDVFMSGYWGDVVAYIVGAFKSYLVGDLALVLRQVSQMRSNVIDNAYLAAVDAPQVEGIARERDAVRPLHHSGAVALCPQSVAILQPSRLPAQSLTGDLPRKVSGNSGGHFM